MVRERSDHPPSFAEAKKMKSLTLRTHILLGLAEWIALLLLQLLIWKIASPEMVAVILNRSFTRDVPGSIFYRVPSTGY